eukprot:3933252-Rhodomonas_salina.1
MSYKYHERAQVFNERNMVRVWDVAFDGYNGGMGSDFLDWSSEESRAQFRSDTEDFTVPYNGVSFVAMGFPHEDGDMLGKQLPNPLVWADDTAEDNLDRPVMTDPEGIHHVSTKAMRLMNLLRTRQQKNEYKRYKDADFPDFAGMELRKKLAGTASAGNESSPAGSLAFQGSMR